MPSIEHLAALIRITVSHETMRNLYASGVVRPDQEAEDLALALGRLASAAVAHGFQISR